MIIIFLIIIIIFFCIIFKVYLLIFFYLIFLVFLFDFYFIFPHLIISRTTTKKIERQEGQKMKKIKFSFFLIYYLKKK